MRRFIFLWLNFFAKIFLFLGAEKIPGVFNIYYFIFNFSRPKGEVLINCQGNKLYINPKDVASAPDMLIHGVYEPYETELIQSLLKKKMRVVIIGANIGYYTLIAAKKVGSQGTVYSFEPEPNSYRLLKKNIQLNNCKNVFPMQAAVSNKKGTVRLFLDAVDLGGHSLAERNIRKKNGFVTVKANSLDNFIKQYDKGLRVDLIKTDTQGSEELILAGAKQILKKNKLKILMEFWPYGLKNMGTDPIEFLDKMKKSGLRMSLIDEERKGIFPISEKKIVDTCLQTKGGRGYVNLLLEN